MSLQTNELVPMETTDALVERRRPHEISIPPSSPSDTLMASAAGGGPTREQLTRGDPEREINVVNQKLRDELAELQHSYHLEVHASRLRHQELSTRYSTQAWRAIHF